MTLVQFEVEIKNFESGKNDNWLALSFLSNEIKGACWGAAHKPFALSLQNRADKLLDLYHDVMLEQIFGK